METEGILRVAAGGQGYGGHTQGGLAGQPEHKPRKLHALHDAIKQSDWVAARHAYLALMNLEPALKDDSQWRALGHALDKGELYVAQHFMNALPARVLALLAHPAAHHAAPAHAAPSAHEHDPAHGTSVNLQA